MFRKRSITTDVNGNIYVMDEMVSYDHNVIKEHLVANERLKRAGAMNYYLRCILYED